LQVISNHLVSCEARGSPRKSGEMTLRSYRGWRWGAARPGVCAAARLRKQPLTEVITRVKRLLSDPLAVSCATPD
jgi:hypothetical protein